MSSADTPSGKPIAVALRYDAAKDAAPRVTASGQGAIAEQILNIAFAKGIKVRQDAPLAEILGMLEVDTLIPLEAYAAVAEILSYVYKADAQEGRAQTPRGADSLRRAPPTDLIEG